MKIYDCFIFFNELDLLELRLNILNDSVDYFVLVESAITFQGKDKEFIFEKNKDRFAEFNNKIIYFKVAKYCYDFSQLPYIDNPKTSDEFVLNKIFRFIDECPHFHKKEQFWWGNDFFQRECIWRALADAKPAKDDLILISDVDEIPNPDVIIAYKSKLLVNMLVCLRQHEYCYYLNYFHNSDWVGTCCFLYGKFENTSLNAIRFSTKRQEGLSPIIIDNGGWHFTSMGDIDAIKIKIQSWGHKEYNTTATLSRVEYNVKHGYDIFRRYGFGRLVSLPIQHGNLPAFLLKNAAMYKSLIGPEIVEENLFQWLYHTAFFRIKERSSHFLRQLRSIIFVDLNLLH